MARLEDLPAVCKTVRGDILRMIRLAGSGHPGGSLSAVELLTTLYFTDLLRCDPERPDDTARDRFILSKGHAAPVLYSVLARRGFFPLATLDTLRKLDSPLQGHPNMRKLPGLDCSGGSLGQGLSIANGLAYALKRQNRDARVYCLMGDGELQEGQIWEAAMFAPQHRLDNVCAIVDFNSIQLDGFLDDIKGISPLGEKWSSFGWNVIETDGHDIAGLYDAYRCAAAHQGRPSIVIAKTVKGKGVSYMENDPKWHGTAPGETEYRQALTELGMED